MATWVRQGTGLPLNGGADADVPGTTIELDNGTAPADFDPAGVTRVDVSYTIQVTSGTIVDDTWTNPTNSMELTENNDGAVLAFGANQGGEINASNTSRTLNWNDTSGLTGFTQAQWEGAEINTGSINTVYSIFNQEMKADGATVSITAVTVTITYTPAVTGNIEDFAVANPVAQRIGPFKRTADDNLYAVIQDPAAIRRLAVWRSTNDGVDWTKITTLDPGSGYDHVRHLHVHQDGDDLHIAWQSNDITFDLMYVTYDMSAESFGSVEIDTDQGWPIDIWVRSNDGVVLILVNAGNGSATIFRRTGAATYSTHTVSSTGTIWGGAFVENPANNDVHVFIWRSSATPSLTHRVFQSDNTFAAAEQTITNTAGETNYSGNAGILDGNLYVARRVATTTFQAWSAPVGDTPTWSGPTTIPAAAVDESDAGGQNNSSPLIVVEGGRLLAAWIRESDQAYMWDEGPSWGTDNADTSAPTVEDAAMTFNAFVRGGDVILGYWTGDEARTTAGIIGAVYHEINTGAEVTGATISVAGAITPTGALSRETRQSHAGVLTPTGSLLRSTAKLLAGAIASAGAYTNRIVITLLISGLLAPIGDRIALTMAARAGTIASSGATTKTTSLSHAGVLTPTATLLRRARRLYAGTIGLAGTLTADAFKAIAVAGSIATSGALLLRTLITKTGALAPAADVSRETRSASAGQLTPTGDPNLSTQTTRAGTIDPSGDVSRETSITHTGAITPTGNLLRRFAATFIGSIASTGDRLGRALINLAGAITPTGDLDVVEVGGQTFQRSFAGTLTMAGTILRQAAKTLDASITPTSTITRSTASARAGTIVPDGDPNLLTSTSRSGALTPAGDPTRKTAKIQAGTVTPIGDRGPMTIGKTFSGNVTPTSTTSRFVAILTAGVIVPAANLTGKTAKLLAGLIASAGDVSTELNPGTFQLFLAGAITPIGTRLAKTGAVLEGLIAPSSVLNKASTASMAGTVTPGPGELTKEPRLTFSGSVTPAGTPSFVRTIVVALSGLLGSAGDVLRGISRTNTGSIPSTSTLVRGISRTASGTIAAAGVVTKRARVRLAGEISFLGAVATQIFNVLAGPISKLVRGQGNTQGRVHSQSEAGTIRHQGRTGRNIDT